MPWRSKKFWLVVCVCVLVAFFLFIAAVRHAHRYDGGIASSRATGLGAVAQDSSPSVLGYLRGDANRAVAPAAMTYLAATAEKPNADHKIVHTVALELVVKDVQGTLERIRFATVELGGFVEKASLARGDNAADYGTVSLRVPQANLERALNGFKQQAVRVANETIESTDVTKQYVDSQAQLRNLHAEEDQYLAIMRRTSTVKDTLEVAEKLSDVRGRIEQLQGEFNYLSHQVEMSLVTVTLRPEITAVAAALEWHPLVSARQAGRNMLAGLADFADTVFAVIIHLPLIALWLCAIGAVIFYMWKLLRWGYRKMRGSVVTKEAEA